VQPLFEHRLALAGYETRALELEGEGPAFLLLHGWSDSADTWRLVLDRVGCPALALRLCELLSEFPARLSRAA